MSVETTSTQAPAADQRAGRIRVLGVAMVLTLMVLSVWITVLAVGLGDRGWVVAAVAGIGAILVSFTGGSLFMGETTNDGSSYLMAVGCAVATAAYALALYRVPEHSRVSA